MSAAEKLSEKVVFCQIDAHLDTNPKIRKGGRDARDVFEFILRRVAIMRTEGTIPLKYLDAWYLADQLMMTEEEARHGTSRAVTVRLIEIDEGSGICRVVGWSEEWGRRPLSGGERTKRWRDKSSNSNERVTECDDVSSRVTVGDESDVGEERRGEENNKGEGGADAPPSSTVLRVSKIPDRAWRAADYLRQQILTDAPKAAVSRKPWDENEKTGLRLEWADTIRLIVERDNRSYEHIAAVIKFVFQQQTGKYKFIVQSADALREKLDNIEAVMKAQSGPQSNIRTPQQQTITLDYGDGEREVEVGR